MSYSEDRRGIITLITDVIGDTTDLFQTEIRLIRAEINDNVARLTSSITVVGSGAVIALAALIILLHGVVSWLALAGVPPHWGFLLVGILTAAVAAAALSKGLKDLKASRLVPDRSIQQLKADLAAVKEHV